MGLNQNILKSGILRVFNSEPSTKQQAASDLTGAIMEYLLGAEVDLTGLLLTHPSPPGTIVTPAQNAPLLFPDETGTLIKTALIVDLGIGAIPGVPGWPATTVAIAAQLATVIATKPIPSGQPPPMILNPNFDSDRAESENNPREIIDPEYTPPINGLPTLVSPAVTILAIPPIIIAAHEIGLNGGSKEDIAIRMAQIIHNSVMTTKINGAASNTAGFLLPVTGPRSIK
ncbi:hypothetical protein CMI47_03930 [Candidatus Pacearchaeota archaeon]|nr:hypothetical protein [Candidatus Pacearchaeota archaeon]